MLTRVSARSESAGERCPLRLERQTASNRSASTLKSLEPSYLELLRLAPQQGRRISDSERSAELIRKHDEPTSFLLPKVLTRVSARSESAGERCPLRLERQTASNRSASTLKSLEPFRLEPQNDLEPSCLKLLRLAPQQGRRVSDSERSAELIRKHDEPTPFLLPKVLTRVSARSESADAHRPLRLERQPASNYSASNFSASPPTGAAGIGQRTRRGTYSEARRAYSLSLPKVLTRVSARSESAGARRPLRLEQSTVSNHPASNAPPRTSPPRPPQQGRRSSDSERSAELIRKHDEPTPFLLPKVLPRVSARSESADERRPLRLERQTASNVPPRTPNDLEPSALIFRTVSTPGTPYPAAPALSPRHG